MHVLVKFFCLASLALALSFMQHNQLIMLVSTLSGVAFILSLRVFTHTLRRVKWLLIILIIIYTFSTPGEYIQYWKMPLRPTYEGLIAGLSQMLNIVAMLASISLILSTTPRAKLIGGLYQLLSPLRCFGMNAENFAVRIWLTLHYVESRQPLIGSNMFDLNNALNAHLSHHQEPHTFITIDVDTFKPQDYMLIFILLLGILYWAVC